METLSKGYKKPETGLDTGDEWFEALAENIQRLNDHTHDGDNSQALSSDSFSSVTTTISSGSWGSPDADNIYSQTVSIPNSTTTFNYDTLSIQLKLTGTGEQVYCPILRGGTTASFIVKSNDNTLALTAFFIT